LILDLGIIGSVLIALGIYEILKLLIVLLIKDD